MCCRERERERDIYMRRQRSGAAKNIYTIHAHTIYIYIYKYIYIYIVDIYICADRGVELLKTSDVLGAKADHSAVHHKVECMYVCAYT